MIESFSKGVDGGDGTDIINITDGSKLTAIKYITNFETLDVSGAAASTFDVSLNSFATVQIDEALGGARWAVMSSLTRHPIPSL